VAIHPGVERHQVGERHHHVATDSVVIGVVGRLQRLKRIELAIRAMPAVLRGAPQATLRIVGAAAPGTDEGYEDELRSEAQALGVAAHVEFRGHAEDGASAIRELDILVHCASVESFGMVPVEALAHGIPVVGADAGGLRETVRDGIDGLRIDPADSEALAAAVLSLAAEPARRAEMGSQGHTRVLAAFTAERTAQRAWRVASAVHRGQDPVTALDEAP
jgi:glycosyltransferase involved in cell wall biosynthesis